MGRRKDHPRESLDPEWVRIIRAGSRQSEATGRLGLGTLDLIYREDWLRVMVPASLGGKEWTLPRVVAFFESLGWADGSVGWCVNLGAGANMFCGYLRKETAETIFTGPKIWCAGSGAVTGSALPVPGGYEVSGRWKYASGSAHATHFTANCAVTGDGVSPVSTAGGPAFRSIIVPREEVSVFDTWKVTGLKATSSNDFSMEQVFVPRERVFSLTGPSSFESGTLYQFPFEALAVVNMACMATGITLHFIDLFTELMERKKPMHSDTLLAGDTVVRERFTAVTEAFYRARGQMYESLGAAWDSCRGKRSSLERDQRALIVDARRAASAGREVFHQLFPCCGMDILYQDSGLNRTWRDMAVASQHYLLGPLFRDGSSGAGPAPEEAAGDGRKYN
jgi:alkylation response protein AidB-like acyl-CoA dehydrogenase